MLADDLDPVMIQAIERQPADMPLLAALRQATIESFEEISDEDYAFEKERVDLVYSVPELRGVIAREFERNIELMVGLAAARTGRSTEDFEIRALAGALTGAMLAQAGRDPFDLDQILRIIDFLGSGMPI
ncbi:acyl-CoA-like ligand-binding transcription factor [Rhodococcus sp. NPDC055112]